MTRLLSNVIKSYTIRYKPEGKMTIDYKDRDEELQAKRNSKLPLPQLEEGFEEGLKAVVVDPIVTEEEQMKRAGAIIEKAKKEAAKILEDAKEEAQTLKANTIEEARTQGYEEGKKKGSTEIEQIKRSLLEQKEVLKKEYDEMLVQTSQQVTELMISLISKLTGIFVEDKTDIILYLVEKALLDDESMDDYTIRVSREDLDVLSSKKEYIEGIIGKDVQILVDTGLNKNQCLIETENKVINCSLDVQLSNLITDLKLLSSI